VHQLINHVKPVSSHIPLPAPTRAEAAAGVLISSLQPEYLHALSLIFYMNYLNAMIFINVFCNFSSDLNSLE